jgi:hypothetical protein
MVVRDMRKAALFEAMPFKLEGYLILRGEMHNAKRCLVEIELGYGKFCKDEMLASYYS